MFEFSIKEERSLETYVERVPLTRIDAVAPDQEETRGPWSIGFVGMGSDEAVCVVCVVVWEIAAAAGRAKRVALLNEGNIILSVASRRQSSRTTRTCWVSEEERNSTMASTYIRTLLIIN
jgi:hypothetical protein